MANTFRPEAPSKVTVVEEGTAFKGTLTSSCPIDVRGKIEGELETPVLTVSNTGAVHGRAKVGAVRSQGELSGEFDADSIELSGVVRDNTVIRARSLDVKLASAQGRLQIAFGSCELSVGEEPTEFDRDIENRAKAASAQAAEAMSAPPVAAQPPAPLALVESPAPATLAEAVAAASAMPEAADDGEAWEGEADIEADAADAADAVEAGTAVGKRRRKRKNGQDETKAGWSHPPSQPPPAS